MKVVDLRLRTCLRPKLTTLLLKLIKLQKIAVARDPTIFDSLALPTLPFTLFYSNALNSPKFAITGFWGFGVLEEEL